MTGKRRREKGNNLERLITRCLRTIGYKNAQTSRAESKNLDDLGVDIANVPFLIQCKCGYDNNWPRFGRILAYTREQFKKQGREVNLPIVLVHRPKNTKVEDITWSFRHQDIMEILEKNINLEKELAQKNSLLKRAVRKIADLIETNNQLTGVEASDDEYNEIYKEVL